MATISPIPLVVVLWQDANFRGIKRAYIRDAMVGNQGFPTGFDNHTASAIGIHAGPNFDPANPQTVSFYDDYDNNHNESVLLPGAYPDLRHLSTTDPTQFVDFNDDEPREGATRGRSPPKYVTSLS